MSKGSFLLFLSYYIVNRELVDRVTEIFSKTIYCLGRGIALSHSLGINDPESRDN